MNKIIITGRVGKTPEIKSFEWGKTAAFTVAVDESYKDKDGNKVEKTEWFNISVVGDRVPFIQKFVDKGQRVLVEGSMRSREYEKDGQKRTFYEILAMKIEPIDWPEKEGEATAEPRKSRKAEFVPLDQPVTDDLPF